MTSEEKGYLKNLLDKRILVLESEGDGLYKTDKLNETDNLLSELELAMFIRVKLND